jgi:DNA-binding MarR family transcriptional regulator
VTHPTVNLDDDVHQRVRLGILTVLTEADRADFRTLAEVLNLTPGNLSRNLTLLAERGYVTVEKVFEHRRPRTWVEATAAGRQALAEEIAALREVVRRADAAVQRVSTPPARPGLAT